MTNSAAATSSEFQALQASPRAWIFGIVYWLAFLMVLEPGNIFGGGRLILSQEILRITAATLLGTSVTPLILILVRRFSVEGPRRFVRVHRGAIVSLDRVEGITPLGSGDASLRLSNGAELRLSRKYRRTFLAAWPKR